jgi:hypothetical protein
MRASEREWLQQVCLSLRELHHSSSIPSRNRGFAEAVKREAEKALEATGGAGYFRRLGLERILRDAQAAQFHPMPARKQHRFTGRLAMGLDPTVQ